MNKTIENYQKKATDMVIAALEKGVAVWTQPWIIAAGDHGFRNRTCYRGTNILVTAAAKMINEELKSNVWITFNRYDELKKSHPELKMKKGTKGVPVVYWFRTEETDEDGNIVLNSHGNPKRRMYAKTYIVFNASCFEGANLEDMELRDPLLTPARCDSAKEAVESLLSTYKGAPRVEYVRQGQAYYNPGMHKIVAPPYQYFKGEGEAFSTLAHELVHSTGKALGRKQDGGFASEAYSYEELVAECGATILCARYGYLDETVENSAAYLKGWAQELRKNPNWLYDAMRDADKAVALILGTVTNEESKQETEVA